MKLCELTGEILSTSKPVVLVACGFIDESGHFHEDETVFALKEHADTSMVTMCLEKHERNGLG